MIDMIFSDADLLALWVTLKLATVTLMVLLAIGIPLAWWLATSRWRYKYIVEALVALPLVLPPTVLGFYLLLLLSPGGALGQLAQLLGSSGWAFTFTGLVIGSVVYSLPFVVQPLQDSFAAIGRRPFEVAASLGAGPWDRFRTIALPLAKPGLVTASVLGFAHTLGEFGVVLMVGGNIPGETQVVSIAIYDHVESLQYVNAHALSALLLGLSFVLLIYVYARHGRLRVIRS